MQIKQAKYWLISKKYSHHENLIIIDSDKPINPNLAFPVDLAGANNITTPSLMQFRELAGAPCHFVLQ